MTNQIIKGKVTLHPRWNWNIYVQVVTIIVGIYTILTPPLFVLKYVFKSEVEKAIRFNNDNNNREHQQIKSCIIDYHPDAYRKLYNTRGGSFVPDIAQDKVQ